MRHTIDGSGREQERLKFDDLVRYLERHTFDGSDRELERSTFPGFGR